MLRLVVVFVILAVWVPNCLGCECPPEHKQDQICDIGNTVVLFKVEGRGREIPPEEDNPMPIIQYNIRIKKVFKQAEARGSVSVREEEIVKLRTRTNRDNKGCGLAMRSGEEFYYAGSITRGSDGFKTTWATVCSYVLIRESSTKKRAEVNRILSHKNCLCMINNCKVKAYRARHMMNGVPATCNENLPCTVAVNDGSKLHTYCHHTNKRGCVWRNH